VTFAPRLLLLLFGAAAIAGITHSRSCGYEPVDRKGEGEPCTRSDECEIGLECRGAVCMQPSFDAGPGFDAGHDAGFDAGERSTDAGQPDTGVAPPDGGGDAATTSDAGAEPMIDAGP
jgi:hypothetical protein